MARESFIFYKSFYDSIKELAPEEQVKIYNAIFEYQFYGNEIELNSVCKSIFTLIIPQLKANNKKYINGKKGGRPRKPKGNQEETKPKPKGNQEETKVKANENDNVNVNENDNVNDIINYYMQKINSAMTSIEYEKLKPYIECFEERLDIIKYAIDVSVMNKARNINYLISILKNYKDNDVKTMSDIEDLEEKHRNSKKNPNDATYERVTQNYQKEELSEEDKAVMQELMDFFDE